jgi:hypothetical protein
LPAPPSVAGNEAEPHPAIAAAATTIDGKRRKLILTSIDELVAARQASARAGASPSSER